MKKCIIILGAALCGINLLTPAIAQKALKTERLLVYRVERIAPADAPVIDGKLDDDVWAGKPYIGSLRNFLGQHAGELATQPSEFVVLTDGVKLYIGATLREENMDKLLFNPASMPWGNDSVELYIDPRHDGTRQIQLTVDCGAQKYWRKDFDDGYGWLTDNGWYNMARWDVAAGRGENCWTLEMALDCASFGIDTHAGKVTGLNVCRFRVGPQPTELAAWGFAINIPYQKATSTWGHLLFLPAGEPAKGGGITRADVDKVYPDLTGKLAEVPVEGGFIDYTATDVVRLTYPEVLAPRAAALRDRCRLANDILKQIPANNDMAKNLKTQLTTIETELGDKENLIAAPGLTLGAYDKILEQFNKSQTTADQIYWKARTLLLIVNGVGEPLEM